jgi:deoxycytidylate deaminase
MSLKRINPISKSHAEADAFNQAKKANVSASSATLYVDRAPCVAYLNAPLA